MKVSDFLDKVRQQKPLVHHLTNWVTIYDCANIVKVFGASPVMAHAPEEAAEMAGLAGALVLNIGTLTTDFVEAMKIAAAAANKKGIPVVLDVCGAGATKFRDQKINEILETVNIDIIKGNASEVARVAGRDVRTRGVDAEHVDADLAEVAQGLAQSRSSTAVITGKCDIVAGGGRIFKVRNGTEMMSHVVGTGCMAASVIGTFAAAAPGDLSSAAAAALCCYEVAAEIAAAGADGPGTFKERLFDAVFCLDSETVEEKKKIEE